MGNNFSTTRDYYIHDLQIYLLNNFKLTSGGLIRFRNGEQSRTLSIDKRIFTSIKKIQKKKTKISFYHLKRVHLKKHKILLTNKSIFYPTHHLTNKANIYPSIYIKSSIISGLKTTTLTIN